MRGGSRARRWGVSILELMICLVIFSGVIITFASVFPAGFQLTGQGLAVNKAGTLANSVLEEIKSLPFTDSGFTGTTGTGVAPPISPGASTTFSVCSLAVANGQQGWGEGSNTIATVAGQPNSYLFDGVDSAVFPRTAITVGDPTQHKTAPQSGDAGTFFLPLGTDGAVDVNGNALLGISVQVTAMPMADQGGAAPLATLVVATTATPLDIDMLSATVRVTVGYREKVTGHQGGGKGTDAAKFVTVTAQVVQNETH
ncbi:MAG: type IV pilus modification PilV family protein [Candidatus Xenobia bacterium]